MPESDSRDCLKFFSEWTAIEFADKLVYQEFAFYLSHNAVKAIVRSKCDGSPVGEDEDGVPLAIGSARQYFSNFLQFVLQTHRSSGLDFYKEFENVPKGESLPWIKLIRDDMRNEMERDLMAAGIPTILKPRGVGRDLLERGIDELLNKGKTLLNTKN